MGIYSLLIHIFVSALVLYLAPSMMMKLFSRQPGSCLSRSMANLERYNCFTSVSVLTCVKLKITSPWVSIHANRLILGVTCFSATEGIWVVRYHDLLLKSVSLMKVSSTTYNFFPCSKFSISSFAHYCLWTRHRVELAWMGTFFIFRYLKFRIFLRTNETSLQLMTVPSVFWMEFDINDELVIYFFWSMHASTVSIIDDSLPAHKSSFCHICSRNSEFLRALVTRFDTRGNLI